MCPGQNGFSDDLKEKLTMNFGSVENFKSDFKAAALQRFGSGWIWLVSDTKNNFKIISAPYTESPVYVGVTPVIDVYKRQVFD